MVYSILEWPTNFPRYYGSVLELDFVNFAYHSTRDPQHRTKGSRSIASPTKRYPPYSIRVVNHTTMEDRSTPSVTRDAKANEGSVENSVAVAGSIRQVHRLSGIASMLHNLRLTGYGVWLAGVYLLLGYEIVFIGSIAALPAFL